MDGSTSSAGSLVGSSTGLDVSGRHTDAAVSICRVLIDSELDYSNALPCRTSRPVLGVDK